MAAAVFRVKLPSPDHLPSTYINPKLPTHEKLVLKNLTK
jgi:hypothetical protein